MKEEKLDFFEYSPVILSDNKKKEQKLSKDLEPCSFEINTSGEENEDYDFRNYEQKH